MRQIITLKPGQNVLKGKIRSSQDVLVKIDATTGGFSIEIPDCVGVPTNDFTLILNRIDTTSNTVTLSGYRAQKLQNEDTMQIYKNDTIVLTTDRQNWWIG